MNKYYKILVFIIGITLLFGCNLPGVQEPEEPEPREKGGVSFATVTPTAVEIQPTLAADAFLDIATPTLIVNESSASELGLATVASPTIQPSNQIEFVKLPNIEIVNSDDKAFFPTAFSPDSQSFVTVEADGTITLRTGELFIPVWNFNYDASQAEFSPDGKFILTFGGLIDESVRFLDSNTGNVIKVLEKHAVNHATFNPDGKSIATASDDGTVRLWDIDSGKEIWRFSGLENRAVDFVKFSPNGQSMVAGNAQVAVLLNTATGQEISPLTGNLYAIEDVTFSPDGQLIAIVGFDNSVQLWDANSGANMGHLTGNGDTINLVSFSPNGQSLLTASIDGTTRLWNVNTGEQIWQVEDDLYWMYFADFIQDGQTILTSDSEYVSLRDAATGQEIQRLDVVGSKVFSRPVSSPDGQTIFILVAEPVLVSTEPGQSALPSTPTLPDVLDEIEPATPTPTN